VPARCRSGLTDSGSRNWSTAHCRPWTSCRLQATAPTRPPVPADVLARSTWPPGCPVAADALRYLTLSFWGFDGLAHTGEMLVNASVADGVRKVFGQLFARKFPLDEMCISPADELAGPPTGDRISTSAFVCRPARGQTNWSAHAYGLAIDVNTFCDPYTKGDLVVPELPSACRPFAGPAGHGAARRRDRWGVRRDRLDVGRLGRS
jgi:hypothetical protein